MARPPCLFKRLCAPAQVFRNGATLNDSGFP